MDLGLIGWAEGYELQKRLVAARKAGSIGDVLLICQHPHVITQGRNSKAENLLASEHVLRQMGVTRYETDRGGDITYHGPGQVVGYPIINLGEIKRDVVWYVRQLEEVMIRATADFGIEARRAEGMTGIWVAGAMLEVMEADMRARGVRAWYAAPAPDNPPINKFMERVGAFRVGEAKAQGIPLLYWRKLLG